MTVYRMGDRRVLSAWLKYRYGTIRKAAASIGVLQPVVYRWCEKGKAPLSMDRCVGIAARFGVTAADIWGTGEHLEDNADRDADTVKAAAVQLAKSGAEIVIAEPACAGLGIAPWFPDRGDNGTYARRVCYECPSRVECLAVALRSAEDGIWGGFSDPEREAISRYGGLQRQRSGYETR